MLRLNPSAKMLAQQLSHALAANLVTLVVSTLSVLVLPRVLGVEEFGYVQLYLFYLVFVGVFQFGWTDGVYLRYGGSRYRELVGGPLSGQFWLLGLSQFVVGTLIAAAAFAFNIEFQRRVVIFAFAAGVVILGSRSLLIYVLQASGRVQDYARVEIARQMLFALFAVGALASSDHFEYVILADVVASAISLLIASLFTRDLVFSRPKSCSQTLRDAVANVHVGSRVMFANLANMSIVGSVRFGIERHWGIAVFGKVSLALSISHFLLIFLNAVSIVLYPLLRRAPESGLARVFSVLRILLVAVGYGGLLLFAPIAVGVGWWLPDYADSLKYLGLVFPLFVYEGRMALLVNTFLKSLRRERTLLYVNLFSLLSSIGLTLAATLVFDSSVMAVLSILIAMMIRCTIGESVVARHLGVRIRTAHLTESSLTVVFVVSNSVLGLGLGFALYAIAYVTWVLFSRVVLASGAQGLRELLSEPVLTHER